MRGRVQCDAWRICGQTEQYRQYKHTHTPTQTRLVLRFGHKLKENRKRAAQFAICPCVCACAFAAAMHTAAAHVFTDINYSGKVHRQRSLCVSTVISACVCMFLLNGLIQFSTNLLHFQRWHVPRQNSGAPTSHRQFWVVGGRCTKSVRCITLFPWSSCVCVCANKHAQQSRSTACVEGICMLHTFMCVYIYSGGRAPTGRTRLIRVALVCVHTTHVDTGAHTPNTNRRTGHQFDYTSTRVRACWHRRCNQVDKFKRSCDRTVQVRAHNFDVATHFWSPRNRDGDR